MKHLMICLLLISSSMAMAGNLIQDDAAATGAEVVLRQIANSKHFGKDGLKAVKAALYGAGRSTVSADIKSFVCESSLGSKDCLIGLKVTDSSRPTGFQDLSFDVQVKVYQGKVLSGGPVLLEY